MPQSEHDRTAELHNIPEHTAEAAATRHDKATHLSSHEETVQSDEQKRESKLHHGKEAAALAEQDKK